MTNKIKFDLGVYSFHKVINGPLCADEHKLTEGSVLGILHPLTTVDASNLYCFGIHRETQQVMQLLRKNVRFRRIVTLEVEIGENDIETHAKYRKAYEWMIQESKQLNLLAA